MSDNNILLADIQALIEAYEQALNRNFVTNPSDSNVNIGYQLPLITMETGIEAALVASETSFSDVILDAATPANNQGSNSSSEEEFDIKDYFYSECSITDIDGKASESNDIFVSETRSELNFEQDKAYVKKRFVNDFSANMSFALTKSIDEKLFGKDGKVSITDEGVLSDLNFGIEKCFDCVIKIDLNFNLPALEFTFDFAKQLKQVKALLNQIETDLNPTLFFKFICEFSLGLGSNLICPSNLIGLNVILPSLYSKYSTDLMSLRLDWTTVLGPIVKTIVGSLTSFVENIPRLINPFIDCAINALKATIRYIDAVLNSLDKVYGEVHNTVEKVVSNIISGLEFSGLKNTELENAKKTSAKLAEELAGVQIKSELLNKKYDSNEFKKALESFVNFIKETVSSENFNIKNYSELSYSEIEKMFLRWLSKPENQQWISLILDGVSKEEFDKYQTLKAERERLIKKKEDLYKKHLDSVVKRERLASSSNDARFFRLQGVIDNRPLHYPYLKTASKAEEDAYVKKKMAENGKLSSDKEFENKARVEFRTKNSGFGSGVTKDKPDVVGGINDKEEYNLNTRKKVNFIRKPEDEYNWYDYVFAKYGVDIENKYRESNFKLPGRDIGLRSANKSAKEWIEKVLISNLLDAKAYISGKANTLILALKNIEKFMGDFVETDVRVLGKIQEITHLIRFIRLVYELVSNGISNCEKIKQNKEVFQSILESSNKNLIFDDSVLDKEELSKDDYIAVRSKDGLYETIIDLTDCSDAINHLAVNESNLDNIYEGILNGIYR